ncbi:hypothetical protein CSUI_007903 [Cystoisospora suis]|uniref:Transmembrane protein n=1 Tax=Cystoisospora suis TaxID=483139 RepID=A0A2C6JS45_9APIC|nr:hypothetical protein CSUI_007903 [Cystoisospora suis]
MKLVRRGVVCGYSSVRRCLALGCLLCICLSISCYGSRARTRKEPTRAAPPSGAPQERAVSVKSVAEEMEEPPVVRKTTRSVIAPRGLIPGSLLSLLGLYFFGSTARDQWEQSPSRNYVVFPRREVYITDYLPGVICLAFGLYHLVSYFVDRRKLSQSKKSKEPHGDRGVQPGT